MSDINRDFQLPTYALPPVVYLQPQQKTFVLAAMPRCYMVKKGPSRHEEPLRHDGTLRHDGPRHEGPPPCSPTEASVAPAYCSPAVQSAHTEPSSAEYAELRNRPLSSERSAADTEAAHELLSLAHSLPPPPPAPTVVHLLHTTEPLVPLYTYTLQPTNIYVLADEPLEPFYHTVQTLQPVEFNVEPQVNYIAYQPQPFPPGLHLHTPTLKQPTPPLEHKQPEQETEPQLQLQPQPELQLQSQQQPPPQLKPPPQLQPPPQQQAQQQTQLQPYRNSEPCSDSEDSEPRLVIVEQPFEGSSKEKPSKYGCNVCGKRYATSSNLSRHKQTHRSLDSGAAKRCVVCGKAYVSMAALAMHVQTHRMSHVCGMCGKQFSRPWLLRGHLRSHTGEKPYSCVACGKAFADRSNLRAHLQTHSPDKKYECPHCRKSFALKSYMNKHQESTCVRPEDQ